MSLDEPEIHFLDHPGVDMDMALDKIVPEDLNWLHTDEGPEFVKSS